LILFHRMSVIRNQSVEPRKNLDCTKMEDGIDTRGSSDELLLLGFGNRVKILTNIHSQSEVSLIARRNCGCNRLRERPAQTHSSLVRKCRRFVPALGLRVIVLCSSRPRCLSHTFQRQDPHFLLPGFLEHLRSKLGLRVENEVDREQNGVERIPVHSGKGYFHRMGGETNESQFARLPCRPRAGRFARDLTSSKAREIGRGQRGRYAAIAETLRATWRSLPCSSPLPCKRGRPCRDTVAAPVPVAPVRYRMWEPHQSS